VDSAAQIPSREAGPHRLVWDLHYPAPAALEPGYLIAAVPGNTPREPRGPWALPGRYTVRLSAGAEQRTQRLVLEMDPRVKTTVTALRRQFALSVRVAQALDENFAAVQEVRKARAAKDSPELAALEGSVERRRRRRADEAPPLCPGTPASPASSKCCSSGRRAFRSSRQSGGGGHGAEPRAGRALAQAPGQRR